MSAQSKQATMQKFLILNKRSFTVTNGHLW